MGYFQRIALYFFNKNF